MRAKGIIAVFAAVAASLAVIILGIAAGSVFVSPGQILRIFGNRLFGIPLGNVPPAYESIIMEIRFPRVVMGFLTGAALSLCGVTVQSVLRNPLASPFTLGVSSGASLGAGLVIALELYFLGQFTLPAAGLVFGVATMFLMVVFAAKIDPTLQGSTIILTGMVISLFVNGIVTLMANMKGDKYQQIMRWQTGTFSGRNWGQTVILAVVSGVCFVYMLIRSREMDLLTFGDEQAASAGLDTRRAKASLMIVTAILAGTAVSFAGVIGFVDLIAPHIARKLFGAKHRLLLPMAAVLGGIFMVLCDLAARTVISPNELPVGVVTSLLGAPFFAWVFFSRRKR